VQDATRIAWRTGWAVTLTTAAACALAVLVLG
jgi:hypothetical protein